MHKDSSPKRHLSGGVGRSWRVAATAFLALVLALPLYAGIAHSAAMENEGRVSDNPHDYNDRSNCSVCHKEEPPALNLDPIATCTKCHPGNVGNHPVSRHPLGQTPKINVPSFLPLSKDGKIVCFTCHDPHNKSKSADLLRVDFTKLCASCHAGY